MSSHIERIKANIKLLQEKISLFERELILVFDPNQKFKLEHDLKAAKDRLVQFKKDLQAAEQEPVEPKATTEGGWEDKKAHWKILVATQDVDQLFEELKKSIKSKRQNSMIIQMMANYNMIRNQEMLNISDPESIARRYRQAHHNLLGFIDSLEKRHTQESPY